MDGFDDVMSGKGQHCVLPECSFTHQKLGQGIIMLLSGEPGTGKTLTAESGKHNTNFLKPNPF